MKKLLLIIEIILIKTKLFQVYLKPMFGYLFQIFIKIDLIEYISIFMTFLYRISKFMLKHNFSQKFQENYDL